MQIHDILGKNKKLIYFIACGKLKKREQSESFRVLISVFLVYFVSMEYIQICMFPTCVYNNLIILHNLTVNLLCHICIDCEIHCLDFRQLFASQGAAEPRQINTIRTSEDWDSDREGEPYVSFGLIIWQTYLYKS